jgi:hypothetical protein
MEANYNKCSLMSLFHFRCVYCDRQNLSH